MTPWMIYLITRLDLIIGVLVALVSIFGIAATVLAVVLIRMNLDPYANDPDIKKKVATMLKYLAPAAIILAFILALTPSSKGVALIYAVPKIVNNEHMQKLPDETARLLENLLGYANKKLTEEK